MPSLSVCLLLDDAADLAVRRLWRRLEDDGVATLATYTHGRHVPHLTLADLGATDEDRTPAQAVRAALDALKGGWGEPVPVVLAALGAFTRTRCALIPTVSADLVARHAAVVEQLEAARLGVGRHYRPGAWLPHLTLGPRLPVESLPLVARRVYDVLPLPATLDRLAVVDTSTGTVHPC